MWSPADIADGLLGGLRAEADRLAQEQAVTGLDVRDEVELHPLLEQGLRREGFGVAREQRYPADWRRRRGSEGERCDLVLTPHGRSLRVPEAKATLFDDPDAVDIDEAFWLEIKTVAQFGELGPNGSYTSQLLSTVTADVRKLAKDDSIRHAALGLVLFVADPVVADHDLVVWQDHCLDRGMPIATPSRRRLEIQDRIGNRWCEVVVYPVQTLPPLD
jgi:hypothetical protein